MATPEQITSDLTLELSKNLPPDRFVYALRAFFGYVEETVKVLVPDSNLGWRVHVNEGSNLICIDPSPSASMSIVAAVYDKVETGILKAAAGDLEAAGVSDQAIRHLRNLSEIGRGAEAGSGIVRLWVRKNPHYIGEDVSKTIEEDWRVNYRDYGSVEGVLEAIGDRNGGLRIGVRDKLMHVSVQCQLPEDLLEKAFANFRKRVEVYGTIYYRKNGKPVSISVDKIEPLPDDSKLPTLDDVRGILRRSEWQTI